MFHTVKGDINIRLQIERHVLFNGPWIGQSVELWARPGFESQQRQDFLFYAVSRSALGSNQPPTQWVRGAILPGVKRPRREANHSPPSNAEVKNGGAIPPLPHMS
jgi:hypothetical protein